MRKPKIEVVSNLTSNQFRELQEASRNPFFFSTFIKVIHPIRGKVSFNLYPYQISTLKEFLLNRFNIVLKFRQAGLTELISLYCLWLCMFNPHKNVVIISIKDRVAKKVLRKIKFMYKNLPPHLRIPVINGRGSEIGTSSEMEFSNGSIISSIPTTEEAGRSEAVSLMVIDEAAIVRWADKIWAAAFPTLSTGGAAIINSTAYGVGNFFHKQFVNALSGGSAFNAIRLHWQMHPERDQKWYDEQFQVLGPRRTAQEIDGDFLTSGNTVFDLADIRNIEDLIEETQYVHSEQDGRFRIVEDWTKGEKYVASADIATGRARDYSSLSIQTKSGKEVAFFKGRLSLDKFEDFCFKQLKRYKKPLFAPESNDIGLGLVMNFQKNGYPALYYSKRILRKKGKSKPEVEDIPGWYTTKKNRPIIIDGLETDIRTGELDTRDPFFCHEAQTFIYDERNRPVAMNKDKTASGSEDLLDDEVYTDDDILAKAIGNHVRKGQVNNITVKPM